MNMARRRIGMTLMEVLFAVGIFVTVCTALVGVWITHFNAMDVAQNHLAATHIADSLLAEEAGLAFRAKSRSGATNVTRSVDGVKTVYTYNWDIEVYDTTVDSPDIKQVKVTVNWTEDNIKKSLTMVTCVYWQG